jgi:hypothetical protein
MVLGEKHLPRLIEISKQLGRGQEFEMAALKVP